MSAIERHRQALTETKEARKQQIIETAEKLFIERGLAAVKIQDIVKESEISRVTFYRYFPDIHPLAMEVAGRMMGTMYKRIIEDHKWLEEPPEFTGKTVAIEFFSAMIESYHDITEQLRYMGMFDQLYSREYPNEELASFYQDALDRGFEYSGFKTIFTTLVVGEEDCKFFLAVGNMVLASLEKLAARGQLLEKEQDVTIQSQLDILLKMLRAYPL